MNNSNKIILDLCGGTGAWSKPYKDNGYDVRVITLPDYDVRQCMPGYKWVTFMDKWCDAMKISTSEIYGILAAPPCTMFSQARTNAKTPRDTSGAMYIVRSIIRAVRACYNQSFHESNNRTPSLKFWALENPTTGLLKYYLGKPALVFEPYEYGDPYRKNTAIWGHFNEPIKKPVEPRDFKHPTSKKGDFVSCVEHFVDLKQIPEGYQEKTGYSKREILRSMTPQGFAQAFYEVNK